MDGYEVEASFLGSIIIDGSLFKETDIDESYFVYDAHRLIFRGMTQISHKLRTIDVVTLTTLLLEEVKLEPIGGVGYLSKLADSVPSTTTFKHYEQMLKEAHQLREQIRYRPIFE